MSAPTSLAPRCARHTERDASPARIVSIRVKLPLAFTLVLNPRAAYASRHTQKGKLNFAFCNF
jgi:hypothetical protein